MKLLGLPNKILCCITKNLDQAHNILSFARVNKRTKDLLLLPLYKFNIHRQNSSALYWAAQHGKTQLVEQLVHQYHCNVNTMNTVHDSNTPLIYAALNSSAAIINVLLSSQQISVNTRNHNSECALWCAALGRHEDVVGILLPQDSIQVNASDLEHGVTPLGMAMKRGHAGVMWSLLAVEQININSKDQHGQTPIFHALFHAIKKPDLDILMMILGKDGIDLSHQDGRSFTPLIYAVRCRKKGLIQILLSHPTSSTEPQDLEDQTALWHAVQKQDTRIIKLLLDKGADITAQDLDRETPLHKSITTGRASFTKLLLQYSMGRQSTFNLNFADTMLPPLCSAAHLGNTKIMQVLLDYGWNTNKVDAKQQTPLHFATKNGYYKVIQVLLNSQQLDVNAQDQCSSTALHNAAHGGHMVVVNLLLSKADININIKDKNSCTLLWWAMGHGHHGMALRLLKERNMNINIIGKFETYIQRKSTSLHHAVERGWPQLMQQLLAKTTLNPNITDESSQTPLSCTAHEGDLQIMEYLLHQPDVQMNTVEEFKQPPLWSATSQGHVQVVQRLLQCHQINVNQGQATYWSPLWAAIEGDHPHVAMQLLCCGTQLDVNAQTYLDESTLSLAAFKGHLCVVERLLQDRQVDPNDINKMGHTAVWWAASAGQINVVAWLLKDHVLTQLKDENGKDTLDAASNHHHFNMVLLIQGTHHSAEQVSHPRI